MPVASGPSSIGERIRRLRVMRGMTQRELAAPEYSDAYISQIEAGRRMPRRQALRHIAGRLGVDIDELATGHPRHAHVHIALALEAARRDARSGDVDAAERTAREHAAEAATLGLRRAEAHAEEVLGLCDERRERPEGALAHFRRALELWEREPLPLRVEAVTGAARCLHALGDVRYALHLLESYVWRLERDGVADPAALMRSYSCMVGRLFAAGRYDQALEAAATAIRLEARVADPEQVAAMHLDVARSLLLRDHVEPALESLRRAEDVFSQVGRVVDVAYAHMARGVLLARERRLDDARAELEAAVALLENAPARIDLARALTESARIDRLLGALGDARAALARAVALLGDADGRSRARALRELGLCEAHDRVPDAERTLRHAAELYRDVGERVEEAATLRALGDFLVASGDADGALGAYRQGLEAAASARDSVR